MLSTTIKIGGVALFAAVLVAQFGQKFTQALDHRAAPAHVQQDAGAPAPQQFAAAASAPARPMSSTLDEYQISANAQGHYLADVYINGQPVQVIVDTGATSVALREEDAANLGIFPAPSDYKIEVRTANGVAHMAQTQLREVKLGSIDLANVDALVAERGVLSANLLGMTFLSRLSRVEMASGSLLLHR